MLVKWGSIIVKGSGKLGGHVFSSGTTGASVHTLAKARNPQSKYQMEVRSRFTKFAQGWRDLTESQRESWYDAESTYSRPNRFGDVISLSGKNLYESLNTNRAIIGLGVLNIAPLPSEIPKNVTESAVLKVSLGRLELFGSYVDTVKYVLVGAKPLSNGTRDAGNKLRILALGEAVNGGVRIGDVFNSYNKYVELFGVPTSNGKIFLGTYSISASGQRSPVSTVIAEIE